MPTFRNVLFWTHLVAGITCGVVVFIMSFTGALIALQPQLLLWAERDMRRVQPPSETAVWMGADALLARFRAAKPGANVTGLTLEHDRTQAASVTVAPAGAPSGPGPAPQATWFVNPYTGDILGQVDATTRWRRFFRVNTDWHRWLAMTGEERDTGRWITGVSNAAFLALAITGLYIWIPRVWSFAALRAVTLFRGGLAGKARDFNWHNVIGVWSAAVLVVLTFTAMGISFPKTYNVIYSVTGIQPPPAPQSPPGGGPQRGGEPSRTVTPPSLPPAVDSLDGAWAVAEAQLPSWRSIAMRLPQREGQPVTFTINDRARLNPMARSTLTVDSANGRVVRWEPFETLPAAQRLRTWMRFGHTGEAWGLIGQIVAGLASAGACVLVWTGFALAWRRFVAWRARRRRVVASDARELPAA
jgi:uncharacterized iron-regulated membrane protein